MNTRIVETTIDGKVVKTLVIEDGNGNFRYIPAEDSNPEYQAYLASQKEEK